MTASLKTEHSSEIKAEIKDEMDNIRSTLEEEVESMEDREHPSPGSFFPRHVFDQFDAIDEDIDDIDEIVDAVDEEIKKKFDIDNNSKMQEFDYIDFSKIHISGVFDVKITQSDSYKINIRARDRFFRNLDISKEGDTQHLRHSRHIGWRMSLIRPRVEITLPFLNELRLSGATRVRVSGFNTPETFRLHMSGASQLDAETEHLITTALERLCRDRTVLLIAHRLSTVRLAHRIVLMQEGRIVESGKHDELLQKSPLYRRFCELQLIQSAPSSRLSAPKERSEGS